MLQSIDLNGKYIVCVYICTILLLPSNIMCFFMRNKTVKDIQLLAFIKNTRYYFQMVTTNWNW